MFTISALAQQQVSAACDESCKQATLSLLQSCDMNTLRFINSTFKGVILSDAMQGADDDTLKAALINAVQQNFF